MIWNITVAQAGNVPAATKPIAATFPQQLALLPSPVETASASFSAPTAS